MKRLFIFLLFCTFLNNIRAQAPNWEWASAHEGTLVEHSICVDKDGNSYITGLFNTATATFGSVTLTNSNLNPAWSNFYLVKYNPWGGVEWARNASGHSVNVSEAVAVDDSGNVYITGYFGDTMIIGADTLITPNNYSNGFLAKFTPNGNVAWAEVMGAGSGAGVHHVRPYSIDIDQSGNILLTGYFKIANVTFGSLVLNSADNGSTEDIFIVKCDHNGNPLWARMAGTINNLEGSYSVSSDASGNIFITGWFTGPLLTFGSWTIASAGGYNSFITKYDPNGNVVWARRIGGSYYDIAKSVAADANGNCYVTGEMESPSMTFGTNTIINSDSANNTSNIFLLKFLPNGVLAWGITAGDIALWDYANAVAVDTAGNPFITGHFSDSSITFGSITSNTVNGGGNVFLAAYSSSGTALWAKAVGDSLAEEGNAIAVDRSGDCYITGYFAGPSASFGSITISDPSGYQAVFIAKTGAEMSVAPINHPSEQVLIYPNPSNGSFQLTGDFPSGSTLRIYNLVGQEIGESIELPEGNQSVPFSLELAQGIYFYRIMTGKEILHEDKIEIIR